MSASRIGHVSQVPLESWSSKEYESPIKPNWFRGTHESRLAKSVGVSQFGVNRVVLEPGSYSALRHWHESEDEFVYVLQGELVLIDDNGEHPLREGTVVGFPAGVPNAHHITNRSSQSATYLVVGSRLSDADTVHYPDDIFS